MIGVLGRGQSMKATSGFTSAAASATARFASSVTVSFPEA